MAQRAARRRSLKPSVREAGELARRSSRAELKNWTKGATLAGVRGRHRGQRSAARAAAAARARITAGCRKKRDDDRARPARAELWIVDPIDGTRAYLAGRDDWSIAVALVEDGRPRLAAVFAPVSDEFFLAVARRGRHAQRRRHHGRARRRQLERRPLAGPKRYLDRLAGLAPDILPQPKVDRWRCGWAASRTARSMPLLPRPAATTGTLRPPTFWCTKPAAC